MIIESIPAFAKRTGMPEKLVRSYTKQGLLPHLKGGKCHLLIHVDLALEALTKLAEQNAEERQSHIPMSAVLYQKKKHKGRLPDSIRLRKEP